MNTQIICSNGLEKYADLTREIIKPFGPQIENEKGVLGTIKRPVYAIFVLEENEFDSFQKKIATLKDDVALEINDYRNIQGFDNEGIKQLLLKKQKVTLETPLAFWFPLFQGEFTFKNFKLVSGECYIVICPSLIEKFSERIKERLLNEKIKDINKSLFRITLIHELGHHYSLSNLTVDDWPKTGGSKYINDINLAEGLANLFAHRILSPEERIILAEKAVWQDVRYKLYLDLRYYEDTNEILKILMNDKDYIKALKIFAKLMGAQLELGKSNMVVGKAEAIMDYSDGGGNILAGEIGILFPFRGCVVASKINTIVGRFPRESLIIANDVKEFPDYLSLPENIKLKKIEQYDIAKIIKKCQESGATGKELVRAVLQEVNEDTSIIK